MTEIGSNNVVEKKNSSLPSKLKKKHIYAFQKFDFLYQKINLGRKSKNCHE